MRRLKRRLLAKFLYPRRCAYCGRALTRKTTNMDHVVARSRGGADELANVIPSCRRCNYEKGSLSGDEYRAVLNSMAL